MSIADVVTVVLLLMGTGFFLAGTVGLLRFPDVYTRIHALSKADNLGLGLIVLGLLWQLPGVSVIIKLLLIWALMLLAGASAGHLVGRSALRHRVPPWKAS